MDAINEIADTITGKTLPHVAKQMNCCYLIFMTIQACKTHDYAWHKKNWFLSYCKAVLYGFGCDIILSILMGKSSVEAMSVNRSLALIALAWWLVLFLPYDVFNKFLYFKVGEIQPMFLIMVTFATARRMVKTSVAVEACLAAYPGSYIAVLAGTLVSNGTTIVADVFGDFADRITNITTGRLAVSASIMFTLIGTGVITSISHSLALAFFVVFGIIVESMEASNYHFKGFDYMHDAIGKIIATKDWVGKK
ncbi:uncharacterized protein LOC120333832 [Styela clava]